MSTSQSEDRLVSNSSGSMFPGSLREYCLRDMAGTRHGSISVWAESIADAIHKLSPYFAESVTLHASSVRSCDEETDETLRPQ